MKTAGIYIILLLALLPRVSAQGSRVKFWIQFPDKEWNDYTLDRPGEFLSQRAIDRRIRQGIALDEQDLPVSPAYLDSLRQYPLKILYTSRWMNAAVIETEDSSLAMALPARSFISSVSCLYASDPNRKSDLRKLDEPDGFGTLSSDHQLEMLEGQALHEMGYRGEGMVIAVLDAGFFGADTLHGLDSLTLSGRILGTRSFAEPDSGIYWKENGSHGRNVLSIMGGEIPGQFRGSAPKASFWLIQTEDIRSEYRIEEANWLAGAELADSAGADVINSSLGYSIGFTDPGQNYSYSDMDGRTALSTRAAQLAASRGILVVCSAGNSGATWDPWGYITAPADGADVLAVGAIDENGTRASFSSRGPSYDGRVKPDVMAVGLGTWLIDPQGTIRQGNGTSYSSPVVAGLAACLWQQNPDIPGDEILQFIRASASMNPFPDTLYGYGIPNFSLAGNLMKGYCPSQITLYPNPATSELYLDGSRFSPGKWGYRIFNAGGTLCASGELTVCPGIRIPVPIASLAPGIYLVSVMSEKDSGRGTFIKIQ